MFPCFSCFCFPSCSIDSPSLNLSDLVYKVRVSTRPDIQRRLGVVTIWRPADSCTCLFVAGSSKYGSGMCPTVPYSGMSGFQKHHCQSQGDLLLFLALGMIKRSFYSLSSLQEYTDVCQDQKERKQSLPLPNSSKVLGKGARAELLV